ncbi:MAG: SRPBCC family protein [Rhodobacteraceae bacterium]|nr:SRPBCC family protein [Paracoccaceae bacterium]
MNLSFQEDIALPQDAAFAALTDFDALIAAFMPRGGAVARLDGPGPVCVGTAWRTVVALHGLERVLTARIHTLCPQDRFSIQGEMDGIVAQLDVALDPAGQDCSRAQVDLNLAARSLRGKVLMQPLRLVRAQIAEKMAARLSRYARRIEARRG